MAEQVTGLASADAMFAALADEARNQVGVELAIIGRDLLALQQLNVPKDTGTLEAGLSLVLQLAQLRVRVGLIGRINRRSGKVNHDDLFYGVIVEKGRSESVVTVERRRKVRGRLRLLNGRKRPEDIVVTYPLKVKARAGVPFVELDEADIDSIATRRLADFWNAVIAGASA